MPLTPAPPLSDTSPRTCSDRVLNTDESVLAWGIFQRVATDIRHDALGENAVDTAALVRMGRVYGHTNFYTQMEKLVDSQEELDLVGEMVMLQFKISHPEFVTKRASLLSNLEKASFATISDNEITLWVNGKKSVVKTTNADLYYSIWFVQHPQARIMNTIHPESAGTVHDFFQHLTKIEWNRFQTEAADLKKAAMTIIDYPTTD